MKIITGYKGEAHITSLQDRAANQGSYGTGSYVLDVGSKMTADIISANEIHINDGVLSHQGCVAIIEPGTYDSVEISNGMQGMNRIDRIVARYTKNAETNIENLELVVIEGSPSASTPSAPSYTTGQIQNGALVVDMPLYNVSLSGITISSVDKQFSTVRTQAELDSAVNTLNGKLVQFGYFEVTVPANSYVEYSLEYPTHYPSAASIVATPVIWSDPKLFNVIARARFGASGVLRISNEGSSQAVVGINWIAVGNRS